MLAQGKSAGLITCSGIWILSVVAVLVCHSEGVCVCVCFSLFYRQVVRARGVVLKFQNFAVPESHFKFFFFFFF